MAVGLTHVLDVPLQGVDGTARAARSAEWKDLPFVDLRLFCPLHVPPDEAQNRFVSWQQAYLVKHAFDITTQFLGQCDQRSVVFMSFFLSFKHDLIFVSSVLCLVIDVLILAGGHDISQQPVLIKLQ